MGTGTASCRASPHSCFSHDESVLQRKSMSQRALFQMVHWLRRVGGGCEGGSDAELLQRYALSQDEAAFAALLRRHGPLVWRVCRQHLRHAPGAAAAVQPTL